jgi:hypothetical protein
MCLLIVLLGKTGRPARAVLQFSSAGVAAPSGLWVPLPVESAFRRITLAGAGSLRRH